MNRKVTPMTEIKKGKHMFGTVKVGERGQIVIPKEARELFDIRPGDNLLLLGDEEKGIAIVKEDLMKKFALRILESMDSITEKWESNRK